MKDFGLLPDKTQVNLAKLNGESPREPGKPVEMLSLPSAYARARRLRWAIEVIRDIHKYDGVLARRCMDAAKSPYPGSGFEGSRSTGISDPTGEAATNPTIPEPAVEAYKRIDRILEDLAQARRALKNAVRMDEASGPALAIAQKQLEKEEAEKAAQATLCTSCAKVGMHTLRGDAKTVPQDSTLCAYCWQFERAHGREVPRAILKLRKDGKRIYVRDVEAALGERAS